MFGNMLLAVAEKTNNNPVDFSDTQTAFSHLSDAQLKQAAWLFRWMSRQWAVKMGAPIALWAVEKNIPLAEKIVRKTIFPQFVGGTTLLDSMPAIKNLSQFSVLTILDYGAEAKENEQDFNHTMNENLRAIDFAAREASVPVISTKITGLARFGLLQHIQEAPTLNKRELGEYRNALKRLDTICYHASQKGVAVFIDAEESWIQDTIDHLVWLMMNRYNRQKAVVFNTYQLYRKDRLQFLMDSFDKAKQQGFVLGAKLVRGAYMEKEAKRARELGLDNPINPSKEATDDHYNTALRFCLDNINSLAICNASHNAESNALQLEIMAQKGIPNNHPNCMSSQLYGMSDYLTFNLAKAGYRVAKYMPYGQVSDVIPYLIRRAQENTAVTGEVGRELSFINQECKRRGLKQ